MGDIYHIPQDTGFPWRLDKFVEYQHEVPSIHYRFMGEWIKKHAIDLDEAVNMCWYMACTYNEITCVLFNHQGVSKMGPNEIANYWAANKPKLNFGSARKYAKNDDWFVPLMKSWAELTKGKPHEWLIKQNRDNEYDTYRKIQRALLKIPYNGRFATDCFMECAVYLKDYFGLNIREPTVLDWKNCANLTSGTFNIMYEDERANNYDKTKRVTEADVKYLTRALTIIQHRIKTQYPEQNNEITMFIGKICSFRNLFKNARYGGFHHDRELGVIREYEKLYPQYSDLWADCFALRQQIFPHKLLGELNGWDGIRPERKKMFLLTGYTGVEEDAPRSMASLARIGRRTTKA